VFRPCNHSRFRRTAYRRRRPRGEGLHGSQPTKACFRVGGGCFSVPLQDDFEVILFVNDLLLPSMQGWLCTNAEFIRHFPFLLTIHLCVSLTVKGLCSEVCYGLRAFGAGLRIADRGGVLKGKGTVTAHFILQRELPTLHPP